MTTLPELITRADNVLAVLEGLVEGDGSETLLVDDSVSYPLPTLSYDETAGEWTLTQNTADTDGLYKGTYNLALDDGCSNLTLVSNNVVTPNDNVSARYRACGSNIWTDLSNTADLDGQAIKTLEIRSQNAFLTRLKPLFRPPNSLSLTEQSLPVDLNRLALYF